MAFELTPAERLLKNLLMDVAVYINPQAPSDLRFTGGWVRDKLLGIQSHDIDVAINDMTGYQFGLQLKDYLAIPGNESKYGAQGVAANLHKIEANPEKSKHLETVTTKIFGLDVDLVNLRKETYSDESRNPEMEFGTAHEDALRRDATINAMFFNLKNETVEDLTGRGRVDLEKQIIRTPMEPYQTFKDDPLRVLRLIRFACRYNYTLDPGAEKAIEDARIRKALRLKISRERIGVEVEKMLKSARPLMALELLDRLGLFETIFVDPEQESSFKPDTKSWQVAYNTASQAIARSTSTFKDLFLDVVDQEYLFWILSAAVPWFDAPLPSAGKPSSKHRVAPAVEAIRSGLKSSNKVTDIVRDAITYADDIIIAKDEFVQFSRAPKENAKPGAPGGRDALGMRIRKWGHTWKSQFGLAMMLESTRTAGTGRDLLAEYESFISHISKLDLLDAPGIKPVVDGKTLAKALDTRPGPWMKQALDEVLAWQLRHPNDATAEGAIAVLRTKEGELPSRFVNHFLSLTIRPLFAQTKTQSESMVTQAGRKTVGSQPARKRNMELETFEDIEIRKTWKQGKNVDCLHLLRWCTEALRVDPARTEMNWPLLVPPILALIDDVDVHFKIQGCQLLENLLCATPPSLLRKTGLAPVFMEAMIPCFSYLPTLTPEDESIQILEAAYPAIFALVNVEQPPSSQQQKLAEPLERERELSKVLHQHLLRGFSFVEPERYPRVVKILLIQMSRLIEEAGVGIVSQLQHIVPITVSVLSCDAGKGAIPMFAQAAKTIQLLVSRSWPRAWRWRADFLKAVCLGWLYLAPGNRIPFYDKIEVGMARNELQKVVKILAAAIEAVVNGGIVADGIDFPGELKMLRDTDSRLDELLQI